MITRLLRWIRNIGCEKLDWHSVKSLIHADSDGFNLIAHCDNCKYRVLQDSNGDWFRSSIQ